LTPRAAGRRRGFTLVEMVVALTVTGVVLSLVTVIALRQQRAVASLAEQRSVSARLREASILLPIQLRSASPADIRDARDTSLEMRATIATSFVCDTAPSSIILVPTTPDEARYSSVLSPIEAGDTVWLLTLDDSLEWRGARITAVATTPAAPCSSLGPTLSDAGLRATRTALSVAPMPAAPIGLPVRVTRAMRYSLYRAADGDWYAGEREWNNALARFNSIQPIVGPFSSPAAGGLAFRYADSSGAALPIPVADPRRIAIVDVALRAEGKSGRLVDSTGLTVALRGRR
jgi:prepilin-type N-terminal cleavage/methylation domain-containing protein